jgi:hypothetical protein
VWRTTSRKGTETPANGVSSTVVGWGGERASSNSPPRSTPKASARKQHASAQGGNTQAPSQHLAYWYHAAHATAAAHRHTAAPWMSFPFPCPPLSNPNPTSGPLCPRLTYDILLMLHTWENGVVQGMVDLQGLIWAVLWENSDAEMMLGCCRCCGRGCQRGEDAADPF